MVALSTYPWSADVSDVYWHLHATPKLRCDAATATEAVHQGGNL
jgi:hypothetical protein